MEDLAKRIISLFDADSRNDTDIEIALELPRSTIYDWRNGRSKSYRKYIEKISDFYGVDLIQLKKEQKNKPTTESDEFTKGLEPLFEIAKNFTIDDRAALLEYALFLASKRNQSKEE
ncbi:MAG: hypothetical protein E7L17_14900 [Clostridium sp.]|uniref:hypothetical protein n=1 Tax=Clostridium sp. TaxID=1506 RepID=UPI002912E043|nr:hypothetical protein [Clostridium sp.]MDU7339390.1 hypothetical protein [Clostridium sp.]